MNITTLHTKPSSNNPKTVGSRHLGLAMVALALLGATGCYQEGEAQRWDANVSPIPEALQGTWRVSDADEVTAEECRQGIESAQNFGQVYEIDADGYTTFEDTAELTEVHLWFESEIEARFELVSGDSVSEQDLSILVEDTDVISITPIGDDSEPGVRLVRCPA